jgi:hypothetical protein
MISDASTEQDKVLVNVIIQSTDGLQLKWESGTCTGSSRRATLLQDASFAWSVLDPA